jgi:integrase/recombinase XerD
LNLRPLDPQSLQAIEDFAEDIVKELSYFTFESFENIFSPNANRGQNDVVSYYKNAIDQYKRNHQVGTASNYEYSLKSILSFHGKESLNFNTITPAWLREFESHLIENEGKSPTTVGMYLRPLRAIFNSAIDDKVIKVDSYPFGKKKFEIPSNTRVKKALSKDQLKLLFESEPKTEEQKKAKAFWFFSYACNGMNFKDIANLKYKDIEGDVIKFHRAKTKRTKKKKDKTTVFLNDYTIGVIEKYGNDSKSPNSFIFPILDQNSDPEQQHYQLKNFIRFVNQHIVKYSKSIGLDLPLSTYWARHSYVTNAIRNGASMEFISEALNHSSLLVTHSYFAGFEDDNKREIAKKLMEFK